jgi:lipoprotein-anchoring transpeptidase ErfK/SrfK
MAMKRRFWYIIIPLVFLVGFVVVRVMITGGKSSLNQMGMFSDSLLARLPEDKGLAQKELERVRKALAKIKPSKPYIVIDTHANTIFLRTEDSILIKATCSTGSGGELIDSVTGRRWVFNTPRGVFKVTSKLTDPWWRKPDWAFIEDNESIPTNPSQRLDPEMLGEYALGFGNDYYIHGTIYERLLGVSVTHGCVRVGSEELKKLYDRVIIGTPVYIF